MQQRQGYQAVEKLRETLDEKYLWEVILLYAGESFKTYTGLPFTYEVRKGRNGDYTRELWIDRRENSKSLALSSVLLALRNIKKVGTVVDRPKALGDIRGVSYIYGMFYRFGLIDVPDTARQKMKFTGYIFRRKETKEINFQPHCVDSTKPENLISYTNIEVDGIVTFRGNSFRDAPSHGYADMTDFRLDKLWSADTGSLSSGSAVWTGSGWTGQPLMMKWPKEVKAHMNMTEKAKADDELVEVIYACMDGYVYFLDLRTGEKTRDPLYLGYTFKGAGALDPRGYPIMYVGAGYNSNEGTAKVFVVNLLDCSVMYTFGDNDEFSLRGSLSFFDGSALVDAETDTLIYPGENGILYLIRLNTKYDLNSGTLSIDPGRTVKWRYYGTRSSTESFWLGMEDSAAIYKGYIFMTDNGGNLMCLDLNTLQLVWVQDTLDDSNSTPVLEIEKGHLYLYVSTSFRLGWRSYDTATVPVWKIDAETGEIVWHTDYECTTDDGVSGGVQSTIACGKNSLANYIYVTVAKTSDNASGVLACLRKSDGSKAWEDSSSYAWSSPVCVYNKDGSGKVLYCNSTGDIRLLDGKTGKQEDVLSVSEGVIEASPAVYDNYAVVGTRDCKIWGIRLQ
ncbi:MAG: PQQ-binding-like beta-propeller repeat protein [Blautia faecis]